MNDPWDVKSVRQSDQYVSCMRINGVPLLPPVLSKECRKEMEYYKLLAKEVEKRISILKPYVESDSDVTEDKTDAPELPENEQNYEVPKNEVETDFNLAIDKVKTVTTENSVDDSHVNTEHRNTTDVYNSIRSNVTVKTTEASSLESTKFVIDLSLSINETNRNVDSIKSTQRSPPIELPERDYECLKKPQKELLTELETVRKSNRQDKKDDIVDFSFNVDRVAQSNPYADVPYYQDGPASLSAKSFTGSLHDIHTESLKESQIVPKLTRQSSYTVLQPSPQLLAHLEVQSINTGVEMTSISMSESMSNLTECSTNKKRRSWDLESAKVKWSSMALELKQTNVAGNARNGTNYLSNHVARSVSKKTSQISPPTRTRSVTADKGRRGSINTKTLPKSDPIQKPKNVSNPVRNIPSNKTIVKEPISNATRGLIKEPTSPTHRTKELSTPKSASQKKETSSPKHSPPLISGSDDPATRVRELYEKIQNQQLLQMTNLVEKQKKEQLLLQQVFEEQNNILFKQLKTICPKSPIEVKMAWGDKSGDEDRGPVSLSQLINHKSPERSIAQSPVSTTLTETNHYINHCDNVLKKSRDITGNIKKQQPKSKSVNSKIHTQQTDGSRTRTHSPTLRNTSRKLNYETSGSERDYEPILSDRTNDTLADLNVTFPSDSEDCHGMYNTSPRMCNEVAMKRCTSVAQSGGHCRSTDSAIRCLEDSIQHSMNTMCGRSSKQASLRVPTTQEREAATKIVAHAKGWLVRRLMRTERVQATVQTIRDALLCALQLHQDREGIRGADVDLHRRLIQQITAACYSLHDTFVASTGAERAALLAADRARRRALAARQSQSRRPSDV